MDSLGLMMGFPPRREQNEEHLGHLMALKRTQSDLRRTRRGSKEIETKRKILVGRAKRGKTQSQDTSASTLLFEQPPEHDYLKKYLIKSTLSLFHQSHKDYLLKESYINQSIEHLHNTTRVLSLIESYEFATNSESLAERVLRCKEKVKKLSEKPSHKACELKKKTSPTKLHTGLLHISTKFSSDYKNLILCVENKENLYFSNAMVIKKNDEIHEQVCSLPIDQKLVQMNLNPLKLFGTAYSCSLYIIYCGTFISNMCNLRILYVDQTPESLLYVKNITSQPIECTGISVKNGDFKIYERIVLDPLEIRKINIDIDFENYDYFAYYKEDGQKTYRLSNKYSLG